ncbi:nuclear transcription factor Y subunit A-1 isoform X2 [Ricinus communis]|uniref:nuclear transcription factor Y subunit A-1 isoform X2 n=1 Tax=Ricinus communis TaxID=3988 RepID=UPI000772C441|nr:nuclear transcription factor Y subunit A-1 isoform X2 [Ricinus communis]|eukprot:XP_015573876.1 nuclear transcription factor Y subunit A-1 isoform X2 [Ricinus communis]
MPAKLETRDQRLDQGVFQSSIYSQPWWRGVGNSSTFEESTSKSSSSDHLNGSLSNGPIRSQANLTLDNGANSNKDTQVAVSSQSDGINGQGHHLKQVPSSAPVTMVGHVEPNSQMELVGHSIVLTSYPYSDAQYGGMLPSYAPQAMVTPQLYGMHHARMALPLEMEEEPVYVNAKQFNGILRRRQARAKAEIEKKAIKARKPYLHESRHQHAMRRARGCGGRFLSSKKPESSEWLQKNGTRNLDSANGEGKGSTDHDMQSHSSSHGNGNGHGLSSIYHPSSGDGLDRGFLVQQRASTHWNGVTNGALPIN